MAFGSKVTHKADACLALTSTGLFRSVLYDVERSAIKHIKTNQTQSKQIKQHQAASFEFE